MTPDDVYAVLIEANPVPDADARTTRVAAVAHPPRLGSEPMYTIEHEELSATATAPPRRPSRSVLALVAAAVLVVALGALFALRSDDEPEQPADRVPAETLPALPTADERAVETAREFQERVNAGDVDAVMAMTNPDYSVVDADHNLWEFNAVFHRTTGAPTMGECTVAESGTVYIEVACAIHQNEPVFEALGVADLVAPYRVFPDQTVDWQPWRGGDFGSVNQAYAEYLQIHHADEYEAACAPFRYEPGTIVSNGGLALTADCAAVAAPLADEVAAWIEAGRSES